MKKQQSFNLDVAMNSLLKTAEFQQNFEIPKLSHYDGKLDSAVLKIIDLSERVEKLGGSPSISENLLKIASSILDDVERPAGYEICGTCGYDHGYDSAYPGIREEIEKAHNNDTYLPFNDEDDEYSKNVENEILRDRAEFSEHIDEEDYQLANDCGDTMLASDEEGE